MSLRMIKRRGQEGMKHIKSYIKIFKIYVIRYLMRVLYIFPIKKNRIVFNSYRGGQYSCSPKYISQKLIRMYPNRFEIIWLFNNPKNFSYLKDEGIKVIDYSSFKRFYYEATSKISINNIGSFSYMPLRKGQEHINTWHAAVSYKKVGLSEIKNDAIIKRTLLMTSKETTLYLSACKFFSEYCIPIDFGYYGDILEYGIPRNDMLYLQDIEEYRRKVLTYYGIDFRSMVVLYAPTWRYDPEYETKPIDFILLKDAVEKKFNRECVIIFRAHHITGSNGVNYEWIIDSTDYPDSQEVLAASDIMITDYSSMIWDYSLLKRPCFLYVPDLKTYISERGFHIPIKEWGFPLCETNEKLRSAIFDFDESSYLDNVHKHHMTLGSYETGHSAEKVCEWINSKCFKQ